MNVFSIQMNLLHLGNLELFDDFTANTNYLLSEPEQLDILCKTTSGRIDQSQLWNHSPCMNRAVVHARFNIVKNFTNECFATKSKNCPHCFYPQLIFKNDKNIRIISTKRKSEYSIFLTCSFSNTDYLLLVGTFSRKENARLLQWVVFFSLQSHSEWSTFLTIVTILQFLLSLRSRIFTSSNNPRSIL